MIVKAISTRKVKAGDSLDDILDESLSAFKEQQVLIVTSKIVALCENLIMPIDSAPKAELIKEQSDYYLDETIGGDYIPLTIKGHTLIPAAGIDASNSNGQFVLWPSDPQASANMIRQYLVDRFNLKEVGVIITDSSALPLHFGTLGVPIAYSGIRPHRNYKGQKDLDGFWLKAGKTNLVGGLAAAAVVVMGEGTEQTPLAIISGTPAEFNDDNPDQEELSSFFLDMNNDKLFAPFFQQLQWQKGGQKKNQP